MITKHKFAALAVTLLLSLAASAGPPARPPAKPSMTDLELENAIRQRFARSKSAEDKFTVRVQGGVATLEGKTAVVQRKSAATRMAKAAGARQVVNKIQVDDAARQKAAASLATGRRRAQVKRSDVKR
ncbi:MAG: BON domain-containing protein [Bryobacteraceae bacterium]